MVRNIKGQTSIEFMLIVLLMLIYLTTQIQPAMNISQNILDDTKRVALTVSAVEQISSNIEEIAWLSGQSQKTITLFVPKKSTIECNEQKKYIKYFIKLDNKAPISGTKCKTNKNSAECNGTISLTLPINSKLTCDFDGAGSVKINALNASVRKKMIIFKNSTGDLIVS